MDKKSVIRFASLMTAVLISASSLPRLAVTVSAEQATNSVTAAAGEVSLVSYKTYAADMTDRKSAEKSIALLSGAARVYGGAALKSVNGKDAVVFSKSDCGAEWKFTVPEDALYNIRLSYTAVDTGVDYAFTLKTDGKAPFEEAKSLTFPRVWQNAQESFKTDRDGNDLTPRADRNKGLLRSFGKKQHGRDG